MTIPESQLETWSHIGAITTSKDTYATIKRVLESRTYNNQNPRVFLQGSYGNDTNIAVESDVDVVICYEGAFYYDLEHLQPAEKEAFKASYSTSSAYAYATFKSEVGSVLQAAFGDDVNPPGKAFKIAARGARRKADVIVAFEHRRYAGFKAVGDKNFYEGISFLPADGRRIDNFPDYHSKNLTTKHQATGNRFKPAVRVFKNIRSKLMERGDLEPGDAPSYFIEGLLYNAPNACFAGTFHDTVFAILTWLYQTNDRSEWVCANERYFLLRDNSDVCWPIDKGNAFINAAIALWNNWPSRVRVI